MNMMHPLEKTKTPPTRTPLRLAVPLLILFLSTAAQAQQFTYFTNADGSLIVSGYRGGGAVTIPSTVGTAPVVGIFSYAFWFSGLTSVTIPSSITNIGIPFCYGTTSLTNIMVDSLNQQFSSVGGVLFDKSQTTVLESPQGIRDNYVVPNGVISIGFYAFAACNSLTNVTLPSSLVNIGDMAFNNCSISSISIPNGVTNIGAWTFAYCAALPNVSIPASVANIGGSTFYNCSSLTNISVDIQNTQYCSLKGVLFSKDMTALIQYPSALIGGYDIPHGVVSINDWAFSGCSGLTNTTIPDSVTYIGESAFEGCGLTSIVIPGSVTNVGGRSFINCPSLTNVILSNGVASVEGYAFSGCPNLISVTLPASIVSIGNYAFSDCPALTSVYFQGNAPAPSDDTSVFEGATATAYYLAGTIGWRATFNGLPTMVYGSVLSDPSQLGYTTNSDNTLTVSWYTGTGGDVIIPSSVNGMSVTGIGYFAFNACSDLTSVTMPDSITNIDDYAFYGCSRLTNMVIPGSVISMGSDAFGYCDGLTNVIVLNGVASIGSYSFESCGSLTSFSIPGSITNIGEYAFYSCSSLTNIEVDAQNMQYSSESGVLFNKNKTTLIQCPNGMCGSYTIPEGVTSFDDGAFLCCANLAGVIIPGSVTNIGGYAFSGCNSLISVTIFNGVASIDYNAFDSCSSLASIIIPGSVTYIGDAVFYNCSSLTNVTMLNGVTSISSDMFGLCSSLVSIIIPGSVTNIGGNAFNSCSNLTSVIIPGSVTNIGDAVFYNCGSLTNVAILGGVASIGSEMFCFCSSLVNVTIPGSVTNISRNAFYGCSNLTSITIPNSVTSFGNGAFWNCSSLTSIFFQGNAPLVFDAFWRTPATIYYLPSTTGWGPIFDGRPAVALLVTEPPVIQDSQATLNWTAMPGKTCRVEYRVDLTSGDWTTVTNLTATQLNMSLTLPVTGKQGFYRIGMKP